MEKRRVAVVVQAGQSQDVPDGKLGRGPARFGGRIGPGVAIPRLGYRLDAVPSGTELLAQRPHDRIDNVAADMGSSPDALDKILPSPHGRRTINQLAENLRF